MKKILSICVAFLVLSCGPNEKCVKLEKENSKTEQNLDTYKTAWEQFFENRDPSAVTLKVLMRMLL